MWEVAKLIFSNSFRPGDDEDKDDSKRARSDDLALPGGGAGASAAIAEVGTTTPADDFRALLRDGTPLVTGTKMIPKVVSKRLIAFFYRFTVAQQLEQVVLRMLNTSFGRQLFDKICSCLEAYREVCIECDNPELYNDFMQVGKSVKHFYARVTLVLLTSGA